MRKLKLFEEFEEEDDDFVTLPGDEDYDYVDMEDDEEFTEFRNEIYADIKYSSEKIIDIIGHDNETDWFELVNEIPKCKDKQCLHDAMGAIREFLSKFDIKQINTLLNDD
jgi:hypothetical protein